VTERYCSVSQINYAFLGRFALLGLAFDFACGFLGVLSIGFSAAGSSLRCFLIVPPQPEQDDCPQIACPQLAEGRRSAEGRFYLPRREGKRQSLDALNFNDLTFRNCG
jgi:hypothetical protein